MAFNSRQLLITVAAVVVVAAAAIYYFVGRPGGPVIPAGDTPASASQPAEDTSALMVAGPLGEMALGDANAPNVVIEYVSMTCPHCQAFHAAVYRPFKAKYVDTGKVYFILREYPLDPLATAAAMLARCAPKERFFPLIDLMFDNQRQWAFVPDPKAALRDLVKQAGISEESFEACLTNQEILDGVNWVKDRATKEFGVTGTPAFFVNGEMFKGERTLAAFDQALGG